ncbi:MAG: DUF1501 domain-containing protein [Myxococcaceae bacterium]|nr:DUF1501 domain-containing protein [Myxococcaceae bacterium]
MSSSFSRRSLLQGAAAVAGAGVLGGANTSFGQSAVTDKPALLVVFLNGGYNSLFPSHDSFQGAGAFGCSAGNALDLGNGLVVDATFRSMPAFAQSHMASVGIRHGLTAHEAAQPSLASAGGRSYLLQLARVLGGDAAIKAAVVGGNGPDGPKPAEGDVSMQTITDMRATIAALGGDIDPSVPNREIATNALVASTTMSKKRLVRSPNSLLSVKDGLATGVETLRRQGLALDYPALCMAYGVPVGTTGVSNFRTQMMAADLMVQAGANVVFADDVGWDTHGDTNGNTVRDMMSTRILPPLNTFMSRLLETTWRNVNVAIYGDFARSLPGSDHQGNLTATVIGKNVRVGTTGKTSSNVGLAAGTPGIQQFWAYLAALTRSPEPLFGANPHTAITL